MKKFEAGLNDFNSFSYFFRVLSRISRANKPDFLFNDSNEKI
jgi:hypothetical protein